MSNDGLWNRRFVVNRVGDIGVRHDVNHVTVLCRYDADVVICIEMDQAISGAKTQTRLQWHTHIKHSVFQSKPKGLRLIDSERFNVPLVTV